MVVAFVDENRDHLAVDELLWSTSRASRPLPVVAISRVYDEALALLPPEDRRAQRTSLIMASIYRTLLVEIQRDRFQVLNQRISLTPIRKLWLAWKTYVRG